MKSIKIKKLLLPLGISLMVIAWFSFVSVQQTKKPWEVPAKYKTMKNPAKATAESITLGKSIYNKHCKSCHGAKGQGDGPKAVALKTKIHDFTAKNFKTLTDGEKYYMSFVGRDEMPNFEKKILEEDERWAVINFINSL